MLRRFDSSFLKRPLVWVVALCLFLLTGCNSLLNVRVDVNEDGSGVVTATVELDQETTAAIIDLDTVGLALNDLDQAGWQTEPPERLPSGGLRLIVSKSFGTPEQFLDVLDEISGDARLFDGFELTRSKAFARVDYQLTGALNPRGIEVFGDEALTGELGRSIESLAGRYNATAADATVVLRVKLPGNPRDLETVTGEVPGDETGTVRVWTTTLDAAAPTAVVIASTTQTVAALVWRGVAIVAAVLAGLVLLGQLLRVLRPQNRRGRNGKNGKGAAKGKATTKKGTTPSGGRPKPKPRVSPVLASEQTVIDGTEVSTTPLVVALDGMGVIYREGNDIQKILIPFVREMGSEVTEDEIISRSRSLSLGRITPADFWKAVEVVGDPNELDDLYLARHQLSPGVIKFLRTLRDQGVQVACVTNDATTWANKLRVRHSLEGLIDPWIMSGAVGVRKPDAPIYEVLRRVTGKPPGLIMVVDDDLVNLDAARAMGFRTAWFNPMADSAESNGHAILRSLDVQTPNPAPTV